MYFITINLSDDIEENRSPQPKSCYSLSICHRNFKQFPCWYSFTKLLLLRGYISISKFDIIHLSETYSGSSISANIGNLEVAGYISDCNGSRTHYHLVRKRTLNHLAQLTEWLGWVVSTYLYGAFDCMFLSYHVPVSEWIHALYLPIFTFLRWWIKTF